MQSLPINFIVLDVLDDPVPEFVKKGTDKERYKWLCENIEQILNK